MMVTIESIEGVATLVVVVKIVKTLVGTMEQVVALEQAVLLIVVMLIKLIVACRGHRELKIIMLHKILIMDIGQTYGNNESTWKDLLHFLVMMTIPMGMITDPTVTKLMSTSNHWL